MLKPIGETILKIKQSSFATKPRIGVEFKSDSKEIPWYPKFQLNSMQYLSIKSIKDFYNCTQIIIQRVQKCFGWQRMAVKL